MSRKDELALQHIVERIVNTISLHGSVRVEDPEQVLAISSMCVEKSREMSQKLKLLAVEKSVDRMGAELIEMIVVSGLPVAKKNLDRVFAQSKLGILNVPNALFSLVTHRLSERRLLNVETYRRMAARQG